MTTSTTGLQEAPNATKYFARPGSHLTDADAQVIGPELQRLSREGLSSTEDIVNEGRKPDSPLSPYFTQDVQEAAHKQWRVEASHMARAIAVEYVGPDNRKEKVRAFLPIKVAHYNGTRKTKTTEFLPIEDVAGDPVYAAQLMLRFESELFAFYRRHKKLLAIPEFQASRYHRFFDLMAELEEDEDWQS